MDQPVATPDAWLDAVNITPVCLTVVKYQQLQVLMFCVISLTTLIVLNIHSADVGMGESESV
jgi:hypothetical protein